MSTPAPSSSTGESGASVGLWTVALGVAVVSLTATGVFLGLRKGKNQNTNETKRTSKKVTQKVDCASLRKEGRKLKGKLQFEEAISKFTAALQYPCDDRLKGHVLLDRGLCHLTLKQFDLAREAGIDLIGLQPQWAKGHMLFGYACMYLNYRKDPSNVGQSYIGQCLKGYTAACELNPAITLAFYDTSIDAVKRIPSAEKMLHAVTVHLRKQQQLDAQQSQAALQQQQQQQRAQQQYAQTPSPDTNANEVD